MSIFARPASPPPRQPSPELHHTPLPVRARHRTLSSQTSSAPSLPPGLAVPRPRKSVLTVRSLNDLPSSTVAPPHRRTLSNAVPYRSPPPGPALASPPPPVPPLPSFALTPAKSCPRPGAIAPIHLPDLDGVPPLPEATGLPKSRKHHMSAPEKVAMTCLRFFSLRNSKRRSPVPPSVA